MLQPNRINFDPNRIRHSRITKAAGYSVACVLAILMLTAALPPLVADESDRAILNAPVTLLTSPIAGEVAKLDIKVGAKVEQGATIAEVKNTRVDRSTLLSLQGKAAELQQGLASARSKKEADQHYLDILDREIAAQKAQLITQFEDQNTGLKALVAGAQATVMEKGALHERQVSLVARDTVSPYMLKPTTQQLSNAQSTLDAASAKLAASRSQLEAIKNDIFVGDNLVGIATLAQKRRDVAFDMEHQKIDELDARTGLEIQASYVDAEKLRIETLTNARLTTSGDGEVLNVGAAVGRHVNPGDSLATMVDCRNLFAVAIFSYRQATALSVGTHVRISGLGNGKNADGAVQEIVPKSSDKSDAAYAFPFPQTERREMYVLVRLTNLPGTSSFPDSGKSASGSCPVGKWVTVTRSDGWVPSISVVWRGASDFLTNTAAALFDTHDAEAHQRQPRNGT